LEKDMRKLTTDTYLLFLRTITATFRNPIWVLLGLFQPICWLVLFAPLLRGVASVRGFPPGGALNVFTPGMLIMLGMYSTAFVGFGLVPELRSGLIERFQVTPVSRSALLLGRALRDILVLLTQSVLLVVIALPLGLRADPAGVAVGLVLVLLMGVLMSSLSYRLALGLRDEDALAQTLQFFTLPLVLLSGVTLPLTLAPGWIRRVAELNPLAYAVDAMRALFAGHFHDPSVIPGFAIVGGLAFLSLWWTIAAFRRAAA
jgi:ABC-2 type transport system permease protein